jgi:Fuc2NAc and GlcNAc transferase
MYRETFFLLSILMVTFLVSLVITGLIRRFSIGSALLDMPGERSSHTIPTPRGGGVAFVLAVLMASPFLCWLEYFSVNTLLALDGAGLIVGVIGFIDDYRGLSVKVRLLAHVMAVAWGLYWLPGVPAISVLGYTINTSVLEYGLATLYLVWLLNLYNFMDGIDGIASVEAITVLSGFVAIAFFAGAGEGNLVLPLLLVAGVAGFLCWNFPPAKIFMGDAGSGFLGMMIGLLSLQTSLQKPELFWCWVILLGVFIVDATVTLLRRIMRQQKFYEAHRSHAFQYASRLYKSHLRVTMATALINVLFLFPIALLVALDVVSSTIGVLAAYLPLIGLAIYYKAGAADLQANLA